MTFGNQVEVQEEQDQEDQEDQEREKSKIVKGVLTRERDSQELGILEIKRGNFHLLLLLHFHLEESRSGSY